MCLICVEYEKGKLTIKEAYRNLGEMSESITPEHVQEVETMLEYESYIEATANDDNEYFYWDEIPFGD
tara:strand:- start:340 stop:543 length:204 start_codon:yes stop_codon:yes gene_type:complete